MNLTAEVLPGWLTEVASIVPLILLCAGVITGTYRMLRRALKTTVRDELAPMIDLKLEAKLKPVKEQFQNNGGSSLRDALDRVEHKVDETVPKIDGALGILDRLAVQVLAIRANTDAPYVELDVDLNHTFVNAAFVRLFGIRYEDAMGSMDWETRTHPDDVERLQRMRAELRSHPIEYVAPARIINRRTHQLIYTTIYGYPVVVGGVHTGYVATISVDRTEPLDTELERQVSLDA